MSVEIYGGKIVELLFPQTLKHVQQMELTCKHLIHC